MNNTSLTNHNDELHNFIITSEVKNRTQYEQLRREVQKGTLTRLRNGIYADTLALANNVIDIERIVPRGVLCLYSAFSHYQLSTQVPAATCIAIDAKRKVRLPEYPIINLYYWKKEFFDFGIIETEIAGYRVHITDLERTVCDAIKYRNKMGMEVCGEVLHNYLNNPHRNITRLLSYAKKLRVYNVLTTYLEPLL